MGPITPELLGRLYREHAPALLLYARQWCDAGEDVLQDAFVTLARQRNAPDHPVAWLYAVVRNGARMAGRSESRRRNREATASASEAWFAATDDHLDGQRAVEVLADLPPEQREVIVARIWGGLTFEEIATLAGCSLATAHRRYQTGLSQLQARLAPWTPTAAPKTT
jgi:RNA polymerase sigma factor (sigma-70 family)